jgi:hypothetical protein
MHFEARSEKGPKKYLKRALREKANTISELFCQNELSTRLPEELA